jgi:hypothetical protein
MSREQVEAESSAAGSAAAMRKRMAANLAMKWARATGDLQHSKDRRLAAFISRAGAVADTLLKERRLGSSGTADLMRHAGQLKPHATPGQPGSLTASYMVGLYKFNAVAHPPPHLPPPPPAPASSSFPSSPPPQLESNWFQNIEPIM